MGYKKALESTVCFYKKIYNVYLDEDYFRQVYPEEENAEEGGYRRAVIAHLSKKIVFKDDEKKIYDFFEPENIKNELLHKEYIQYMYKRRDEDGEMYWCTADFTVGEAENGVPKIAVMTIRSIQDIMDTAEEQKKALESALERANNANNAKTNFLSNMSHDIRTPMNAILGYTTIAESAIDDKEKVLEYLKKINKAGNHLLNLINDVLDMSRIESGKINIQERECNLIQIIKNLADMMMSQLQAKRLNLHIDIRNLEIADVYADTLHLNQIFINILGNAIKFTEPDGDIYINVNSIPDAPWGYVCYEFIFKDTGIGMDKKFLNHLFEPFEREKTLNDGSLEGTGLGLSIVKRIVEVMNGEITVKSKKGKGTEFSIVLKFKINNNRENHKEEVKKPVRKADDRRILLVDDNEMNREIANIILSDKGYKVEEASDGSVAVDMLKKSCDNYFDAILMDIHMPVMDGYETTRKVRTMRRKGVRDIPIIAMTSNAFEEDKRKAIECGMNAHIAKPLQTDKLFLVLDSVLNNASEK